ncbi:MAG: S9 family peptidase [Candidatus Promineifilaceae bacterium]
MSTSVDHVLGQITPANVAHFPWPGLTIPGSFAFSPDDRWLTYLFSPDGTLSRHLIGFDTKSGKHVPFVKGDEHGVTEVNVNLEEALRRERRRQRETGVTRYAWASLGTQILVPLDDGLYILDNPGTPLRRILESSAEPAIDARFSPDSQWVAFVQDDEVIVVSSHGGEPRQLTSGARGTGKKHGLAEYIAQEEMKRMHGYWWSPDSSRIAFTEVDETHIPVYRITHQGSDVVGEGAQEDHRYPFAGKANARVRLGVVPVTGGEPVWMDLGDDADVYLARVAWLPDGSLGVQIENREQTNLDLFVFNPDTGVRRLLLREQSEIWINLHEMFHPLKKEHKDGGRYIWASERSGFRHLYLLNQRGDAIRPITSGSWVVDSIAGVDEQDEMIFFTATKESPIESHLYAVSFYGGEIRQITTDPGSHSVVLDHSFKAFVDTYHALDKPPAVTLRALKDNSIHFQIHDQTDPRVDAYGLKPPESVSFANRNGERLFGLIYHPPAEYGEGPFPTLVSVYGGPHAQSVVNSWGPTANMRAQYLASLGYLVFALDNRGTARRGLAFEGAIKNQMGNAEVDDQVDGVHWLVGRGLATQDRIGIYGWSYGGYMACMCLAKAPHIFKAAVAGAPVAHWDGYDTFYTERYMETPESNPNGYLEGSVMHHVDQIQGSLMIIHGLIDENVHFRHAARLINALIAAGKSYELLLFPDARHGPRKEADRIYMEERIRDFFLKNV